MSELNSVNATPAERTVDGSQPVELVKTKEAPKKDKSPDMNTNPASLQGGGE